ncbi:protein SRC2-like [Zingiber officinale]|uniref:C2 domain-containing protein n=1 Tax=Zingiber officinale TaxID=94328 RepID=A0A8J5BHH5_ZINOF|nr:protein SRC2-like [Zingiber officinale]KAG6472231.1 hypothetical protein ZIOFF_069690 [Zingiber officinale]
MAGYRTLEVTLVSAKDLNDVNVFSKMDVYAVVCLAGDPRSAQRTPTDKDGGKNPSWNATLRFFVPVDPASAAGLLVHVVLRSERALGDRDIGEVHIPMKELLGEGNTALPHYVSYQVRKSDSGKPKGILKLSYRFLEPSVPSNYAIASPSPVEYPAAVPPPPAGYPVPGTDHKPLDPPAKAYAAAGTSATAYPPVGKDSKVGEPVTAYPAPGSSGAAYPYSAPASAHPQPGPPGVYPPYGAPPQYGYAPPPPGYGYPPPPQYGYGPPPVGYGYPPPPQYGYGATAPPKKSKFGAGLGAGLLGGALGGILVGDMISDASAYDAGYDAGFDDAGF